MTSNSLDPLINALYARLSQMGDIHVFNEKITDFFRKGDAFIILGSTEDFCVEVFWLISKKYTFLRMSKLNNAYLEYTSLL